ncbi:ATP-binding cassette domain-containing protein [Rhodobacterales bacterium LSUCC0387]|nr:ATP-binding cassette domain-containing protein [Rhodobacterales bacterium LSUCC0374]MBF9039597.1 ATP-binding cassette domain-containing protein [Rhodobacterales bacterium LSUCC0387]
MLEVTNLTYCSAGFELNAAFRVQRGERLALMGRSGAGKSTLISLIAGFLSPNAGEIWLEGANLTHSDPSKRPISILFQDSNLFPHLTLRENLGLALSPRLAMNAAMETQISTALAQVGLSGFEGRLPASLSGGQQSRAAIARVLLQNRPILLMDEPFAALDPALRREMAELISTLCRDLGLTLILASHDFMDAERMCDRVMLLTEGRITEDCPIAGLRAAPPAGLAPWL